MTDKAKTKSSTGYSSETPNIKGILINRDPPISTGWCGNDNCEHTTHKQRRAAQAAADTRASK
jgi:hypothetical protein